MTKTVTIKDTRDNLAEIINRVAVAGDSYIVTKFGKPKAVIGPVGDTAKKTGKKRDAFTDALDKTFGMWADRDDIGDAAEYVRKIRAPRYTLEK